MVMSLYSVGDRTCPNGGKISTITCKSDNKVMVPFLCSGIIDRGMTRQLDEYICGVGVESDSNFVEVRGPSFDRY